MFEAKIKSLKQTTHIVVLPEMFSTGFSMQPETLAEKNGRPYRAMDERNSRIK